MPDGGLGGIRWGNQRYFRELWLAVRAHDIVGTRLVDMRAHDIVGILSFPVIA